MAPGKALDSLHSLPNYMNNYAYLCLLPASESFPHLTKCTRALVFGTIDVPELSLPLIIPFSGSLLVRYRQRIQGGGLSSIF